MCSSECRERDRSRLAARDPATIWKAARGDRSRWIWHTAHRSAKKRRGGEEEGRKQPVLVGGGPGSLADAASGGGGRHDGAGRCVATLRLGHGLASARVLRALPGALCHLLLIEL